MGALQGFAYPLKAADVLAIRRAFRNRWPIPPDRTAALVDLLRRTAEYPKASPRLRILIAETLSFL